jgi:CBS domain-containing protein
MAQQSVRDTMSANPQAVSPDQPVIEAARLMRSEDVGSLPVVEGERLVGVLTDRDITLRVVAEGKDSNATSVGNVLSSDPVTVTPDEGLDEALAKMARHQVRRLPVVEDDRRLVGVLAQADVAREARDKETGELVQEISESSSRPESR